MGNFIERMEQEYTQGYTRLNALYAYARHRWPGYFDVKPMKQDESSTDPIEQMERDLMVRQANAMQLYLDALGSRIAFAKAKQDLPTQEDPAQ